MFFSSGVLAAEIERTQLGGRSVLDVGCGTGVLSLVAARAGAVVTAIDVNPHAVRATIDNAAANDLAVEVLLSDLFAGLRDRRFDLIVVNPPYFAKDPVDDAERAWFAGVDLGYFERFFAGLGDHMTERPHPGSVLMVLSEGCDMHAIEAAATRHQFRLTAVGRRRAWLGVQVVWEVERLVPA